MSGHVPWSRRGSDSWKLCQSKKKKKRIRLPSLLFTAAKFAKVITIHSYDFGVKVSSEDLQWHIALGFLPDGVTISTRRIVANTDEALWKGKQARHGAAFQKGRAPRLLSIGPKGSQKKQIVGVELQFTVQSVKLHKSSVITRQHTEVSHPSCRWKLLTHSGLYIGQLHLLQVSTL